MKIYLSNLNESWVVDRFRRDWIEQNKFVSTNNIKESDIIWIISPWTWKKLSKKHLKNKKVVCSIYHIDFEKFDDKEKEDFYKRDKYVDEYHVISLNTLQQLKTLTDKNITSIPFWVDQNIFFHQENKLELRKKYNFNKSDYIIGSFQRDTEGSDLISPKLIKGPDILLEIVHNIAKKNENLIILLTGKRRQYLINNFEKFSIRYKYFEMVNLQNINEFYNILDLYIVSSRIEGGPQAILECGITKTPILSTNVGVAPEILSKKSIYTPKSFFNAKPDVNYAFNNAKKFVIPDGMNEYLKLFSKVYES